ncbi:class I SAM-dependent methyltransferase [Alteraurantiacibacter aquimixticola]|uniref:Class I SAM-dependent methyltransferase n=1 Tax=Alteraurantiacibacter aquimixticola TaxID=2489173 RepID=A0A4T3F0E7_9SPHN|nr:class I SAM-dependent methyltransferase [Alteraurantiacibacter aquimixticola]TIX48812.1 class I SAM-dependent methyltransferase [Alteraurantiacibacter aquimixticola]
MCLTHTLEAASQNEGMPPFAQELLQTINHGATAMAISIGHRLGIFDTMREKSPATAAQWSARTGLNERYIAEWLGAMATAGIVTMDAEGRYVLPNDHADFLGAEAPAGSMSSMMQWIGVLAPVEDEIVKCFREGGGVPYSAYPRFHEVMAEESAGTFDQDATIALVPGLDEQLEEGISVCDVGCGRGRSIIQLAQAYPRSHFTGYDLSTEAIADARRFAAGLPNVEFTVLDCMEMTDRGRFDLVLTFDAIHDQPHPDKLLSNIARSLAPGGVYIAQDIWAHTKVEDNVGHPMGPFIYTVSLMHCMTVSLAQGGVGLGAAWGEEQAISLLQQAGFGSIAMRRLEHDPLNAYYICRS